MGVPVARPRICPECQHQFKRNGWGGIDAHWKAKHENVMPYKQFWETLCPAHKGQRPAAVRPAPWMSEPRESVRMIPTATTVVGIDVGGLGKGYHVVALRNGQFEAKQFASEADVVTWCLERSAQVIAIGAPCQWAIAGRSRLVERALRIDGVTIECFKTPTRSCAHGNDFYGLDGRGWTFDMVGWHG